MAQDNEKVSRRSETEVKRLKKANSILRQEIAGYIKSDIDRQESERKRLMAAVEQSGETILITDDIGSIVYVNPAFEKITGYGREEAIGRTPRILKSGKQDEAFYREMWACISSGKTWTGRMINKHKDGTFFTATATISPVCDSTGHIVNYVAIGRDITEHLRLESQFFQAQKMEAIGMLAGGVAHDFNNVLNVINGYCELVLDDISVDHPVRADIEQIRAAGQRATSFASQLLAFSRKQILQPEVMNLNEVVHEMSAMLRRLIGENLTLAVATHPNLRLINADTGQIQQILLNLAVNARDAMPQGGGILTIETENVEFDENYIRKHPIVKAGSYVMLAVSDNGVGMDSGTQHHIFEPFFTTKGKGTGLGLATVYGIVKQSSGFIWVYSEPGQGTTFKVYFPSTERDIVSVPRAKVETASLKGSETILVVEDDGAVRPLICRILRDRGYVVLEATEGNDALDIAQQYAGEIHLVITDVVMPGMGGKALVSQLRASRSNFKALFISGCADNAIVHHGILDSEAAFLQKPFSAEALARKVREVITQHI
jgi:two-component system, cell cycle sensor histidine kinase and response regulator CckA